MRPTFLAKVALPGSPAPMLPLLFRPCPKVSPELTKKMVMRSSFLIRDFMLNYK